MVSGNHSTDSRNAVWSKELTRWFFLLAVAAWALRPFATARFIGTGDALWYANMLADFVLQCRLGHFPVFIGQTEYAFNGAVYPLRVAPLFQHLAGLLDVSTGRQLSFFALQHLVVVVVGVAGVVSCYVCLVATVPQRRREAALLTALYITCPGLLGIVYIQDLYMSWMTLPFLPLSVYGVVRSYQKNDYLAWLIQAVGLGGLWLAHAPIAMWVTGISGAAQLVRLITVHRDRASWKKMLVGSSALLVLAQYPFVSVALLKIPMTSPSASSALEHPEKIVGALQTAFPGCLLPLSSTAGELSDLQLGYGLIVALLIGLAGLAGPSRLLPGVLVGAVLGILAVLLPLPYWTEFFWLKLSPEIVRRLTFYWPMHRLYVILATLVVFVALLGIDRFSQKRPQFSSLLIALLSLGCGWSLWETRHFMAAAELRTATREESERKQRPENRLLMNHAYGLFEKLPPYFSNGVLDPTAELRLLTPNTQEPIVPALTSKTVQEGTFRGAVDATPGVLNLTPKLALFPGRRYELEFTFFSPEQKGILQLLGSSLFREYVLPQSGEERAFGAQAANSHTLSLWTSQSTPETIQLRFVFGETDGTAASFSKFATFRLVERLSDSAPIQVKSWTPLTLDVTTLSPALVETPRMFLPHYRVQINGRDEPATLSVNKLTAASIPAGTSHLSITYSPPGLLQVSYWASLLCWGAVGFLFTFAVGRKFRNLLPKN